MEAKSEFRGRILDVLEMLADGEAQLEYQRRVPDVDVAAELFNQWDDAYHPADACFREQFDVRELAALEAFAALIDRIATETPRRLGPLETFMKSEYWRRLSTGADGALRGMLVARRNGLTQ